MAKDREFLNKLLGVLFCYYNYMIPQKLQKTFFITFLVLTIGSIITFHILGYNVDIEKVRQYIKSFGILAPLIFIITYTIGTIFVPSTPFMIVAGVLFGFKYGFIYTIIGGFISSIAAFQISRRLGKEWTEKILEHKYLKRLNGYNKKLETGAVWDLIIIRVTPMPANIINILMGISRIGTRDFIIGTLIGFLPSHIVTVYLGGLIAKVL